MTSSRRSRRATRKPRLVIALSGPAGSGKSTTSAMLAKRFKLRRVSAGDTFRAVARERGMGLIELGRYAETHPKFDKELDDRMLAEARKGGVIIDGRAIGFLTRKLRIPALRVFLSVDPKVSARRVAVRDGVTVARALKASRLREREVARRLKALYGLDTSDTSYYDASIQTDDYTPKEVVALIAALIKL